MMMIPPIERNLFHLAERLNKFVWEVRQMPITEYLGWIAHFEAQADARETEEKVAKGDMTAMSADQILSRLT
jgi:hypothetical protein